MWKRLEPAKEAARALARLSMLAALAAGCSPGEEERPCRIILFSMDTVRGDALDDLTAFPHLARLAEEGVRFRRFYAASTYTIPSHMSMFTGLDAEAHGILDETRELAPDVETLASLLRAAGYSTHAFQEGGYVGARYGFDRGFDAYERLDRVSLVTDDLPRVLAWIRERGDEPYFLFLHTYAAHNPYGGYEDYRRASPERGLPPTAAIADLDRELEERGATAADADLLVDLRVYNQLCEPDDDRARSARNTLSPEFVHTRHFEADLASIRRSYAARIGRIDAAVGRIRAELEDRGLWEDTLLIVTSDHGEAFFEHGRSWHGFVPYDEVLRVPLIVSYPRRLAAGAPRVVDGLTWHLDLLPTVLGLAGLEAPELPGGGLDLTDVLGGSASVPPDREIFPAVLEVPARKARPARRAALVGDDKYIQGHNRFGSLDDLLFDLDRDPGERHSLAGARPERVRDLAERLRRYLDGLEERSRERSEPAPPADPDELEALRDLGYGG